MLQGNDVSSKSITILALAALGFAAIFLAIITTQRHKPAPQKSSPAVAKPMDGTLNIISIDELRVGGRKILLCGVAFAKPRALQGLVTEAARRDYQGIKVACKTVGSGTPCDGKMAATFGTLAVVQCLTEDGRDLAAELSRQGYLCDVPAQSGGHYTACVNP